MLDDIADLAAARRDRGHGGVRLQGMLHAEQKTKTDNTNIFSLPAFRPTLSVSPDGAPGSSRRHNERKTVR